jgi:glycosyltransferase involved in cell wall biosynthesis
MVASNDSIEVEVSSKMMIAVGRLAPQKGFDMLIYAMKAVAQQHGDWILNIFGEGEQKDYLEKMIKDFGLQSNVFLKGYSKNIVNEFAQSGFFVLSSRYEGFPLVLVEALGLGMPCVAFDCPEGPSLLLEDGGGCLVPFKRDCDSPNQAGFKQNVEQLQKSILFMINDQDFRKRCIAHKDVIKEKLSPEVIYQKWEALFS